MFTPQKNTQFSEEHVEMHVGQTNRSLKLMRVRVGEDIGRGSQEDDANNLPFLP